MIYTIQSEILEVALCDLGAELYSVKRAGVERLWQNESGEWNGKAPILFPVCGHCGFTFQGKHYPLAAHGFARKQIFTVEDKGEDFIVFSLKDSDATRALYPFSFLFKVTYKVEKDTLSVTYEVQNTGEDTLYFACGSHESFLLNRPLGEHKLVFEKEEKLVHLYHDEEGYLTGKTEDLGCGKETFVPEKIVSGGETLILGDLNSRKVALVDADGKTVTEITFEGFSNLLLWRPNKAWMICIEPWTNLPDYSPEDRTEFPQKAGVIAVRQGESKKLVRTIAYK